MREAYRFTTLDKHAVRCYHEGVAIRKIRERFELVNLTNSRPEAVLTELGHLDSWTDAEERAALWMNEFRK